MFITNYSWIQYVSYECEVQSCGFTFNISKFLNEDVSENENENENEIENEIENENEIESESEKCDLL